MMENPHAFRKNWVKKKARANRQERVSVRALCASAESAELTIAAIKSVKRRQPKIVKSFVFTLRERIEENRRKRKLRSHRGSAV